MVAMAPAPICSVERVAGLAVWQGAPHPAPVTLPWPARQEARLEVERRPLLARPRLARTPPHTGPAGRAEVPH